MVTDFKLISCELHVSMYEWSRQESKLEATWAENPTTWIFFCCEIFPHPLTWNLVRLRTPNSYSYTQNSFHWMNSLTLIQWVGLLFFLRFKIKEQNRTKQNKTAEFSNKNRLKSCINHIRMIHLSAYDLRAHNQHSALFSFSISIQTKWRVLQKQWTLKAN